MFKTNSLCVIACAVFPLTSVAEGYYETPEPLFADSSTSRYVDHIAKSDLSVNYCIKFVGQGDVEMPNKRGGLVHADNVEQFEARYADGTRVGLWVHPELAANSETKVYINQVAQSLSHLPSKMRETLNHVVLHYGNETAFTGKHGDFLVVYHEKIDERLRNNSPTFYEDIKAILDQNHNGNSFFENLLDSMMPSYQQIRPAEKC